ncbi:uncharacterized protein LOC123510832 [Portunus trituberculatus]|uniref:uncharacterized protein LOC123510832 n=1 Tax=Portunus trituberculatus TaxID=210409 RepID=UPI001E1D045E|nr:uncharacterized protein LOC123510832 [Portunus trituberculatus]
MMVVAAFIISLLMLNHYYTAQDRPSGGSDCTSQGLDATQLCSNHHYLGHPQVPQTSTKASTTPPITARLKAKTAVCASLQKVTATAAVVGSKQAHLLSLL